MGCVVLGKLHYPESMLCVLRRTLYTANESLRDAMLHSNISTSGGAL